MARAQERNEMQLTAIQKALYEAGLDGWLFCNFHYRDPMAYRILGLDSSPMPTRRRPGSTMTSTPR